MEETKAKFGIKVDTQWDNAWSFGICLSHWNEETYIFINFWKWSVSIGKLIKE